MKKPPVIAPIETPPFKTPDLYISTILVLSGFSLLNVERQVNKAMYCFRSSDEINPTISKYYSGELRVDPRQCFEVWKGLRSMAYQITDAEAAR